MERDREYEDPKLIDLLNNNKFKRNSLINDFIKMLNTVEHNTYFSLDGEWGSGKTVFVKEIEVLNRLELKFEEDLNIDSETIEEFKKKYTVFYYNAWENDYHGDPLQSLLINLLSKQKLSENALKNIKNALITIFSENFIEFIKNKSGGLIDIKKIKESNSDKYCIEIITIEKRKELVSKIIDELCREKKLLIILDELDRCSPTFAVRLLETVKHYFNNDKIVFLISTHNSTLAHTVKKFYGNGFNGELYLDKFYDLKLNLPDINKKIYVESKKNCAKYYRIVKFFKMSLREINHYDSMLEICNIEKLKDTDDYSQYIKKSVVFDELIAFGIGLKIKRPQDYNKFINNDENDLFSKYLEQYREIKDLYGIYDRYTESYRILKTNNKAFDFIKNSTYLAYLLSPIDYDDEPLEIDDDDDNF